jgi:hypothetical protein
MAPKKEWAASMAQRHERRRRRRSAGVTREEERLGGRRGLKNSFQNKNWIFEYTKALEICTTRFRRNFDLGIFPNFFWAPQGF